MIGLVRNNLIVLMIVLHTSNIVFSQDQDSSSTLISSTSKQIEQIGDSTVTEEDSPLDIGKDRGLFIITSDGKMQLRILGSVRFSLLYDMIETPIKKTFNTYYIPTGEDNIKVPNYYNSLNESRIGFEITRKMNTKNIFIRLETDFNGYSGQFRIRHAYGQIDNFLVGQTWSLFSNVSSMPMMVNGDGPTGSVTLRTPQIRYSGYSNRDVRWALSLEYSKPELTIENIDSSGISTVQLIPDVMGRFVWEGMLGIVQLSTVFNTISKKDYNNNVTNSFGYGGSISGTVRLTGEHELLYQLTYGKSISHYISTFSGTGNDAVYNPVSEDFESLESFGGFLSYGNDWKLVALTSHFSIGYAKIFNKDFQSENSFRNSFSISVDGFWNMAEGARLGIEVMYGQRWDKDRSTGNNTRITSLFYYDF